MTRKTKKLADKSNHMCESSGRVKKTNFSVHKANSMASLSTLRQLLAQCPGSKINFENIVAKSVFIYSES